MADITDINEFTDPITHAIIDGTSIDASDVITPIQGLANRTKWLSDQIHIAASVPITGTSIGDATELPLTLGAHTGGFTIDSSTKLVVPKTGFYLVTFLMIVTATATASPMQIDITLSDGITDYSVAMGKRFSATASDAFPITGSGLCNISDVATRRIVLKTVVPTGTISLVAGSGRASVVRVAAFIP